MVLKTMSFLETDATRLATECIKAIAQDYSLRGYTFGFDTETEDVLIFFPTEYVDNMVEKETFIKKVKEAWDKSGFALKEEETLKGYTYLHVSFPSYFFRLSK